MRVQEIIREFKNIRKKNAAKVQSPNHNKKEVIDLKNVYSNKTKESFPTKL